MDFFVFIRCRPGKVAEVGAAMGHRDLPEVRDIYSVSGDWDLMVRIAFKSDADFESKVLERLIGDQWDNIKRTHTIVAYKV